MEDFDSTSVSVDSRMRIVKLEIDLAFGFVEKGKAVYSSVDPDL
jgi:hypothetical protein